MWLYLGNCRGGGEYFPCHSTSLDFLGRRSTSEHKVSQRLDKKGAYLVLYMEIRTEPRTERKMGLRQGRLPAMIPTQDSMIVHRVTCHEISVSCEALQG